MILIIGSTHDDILYFESVMANKKEDKILCQPHSPARRAMPWNLCGGSVLMRISTSWCFMRALYHNPP